jgi:hypothetical protein
LFIDKQLGNLIITIVDHLSCNLDTGHLHRTNSHHDHLPSYRFGARQHCLYQVGASFLQSEEQHISLFRTDQSSPFTLRPIRYWGKRNTKLILPTNSSLSVTLDQDHLRSTTSSRADASFEQDRLWLNGKEEEIQQGGRLWVCIDALRKWRQEMEQVDTGLDKVGPHWHVRSEA